MICGCRCPIYVGTPVLVLLVKNLWFGLEPMLLGVFLKWRSEYQTSSLFSSAILTSLFAIFTAESALPFSRECFGADVTNSKPHVWLKSCIILFSKFVPLSLINLMGIPCRLRGFLRFGWAFVPTYPEATSVQINPRNGWRQLKIYIFFLCNLRRKRPWMHVEKNIEVFHVTALVVAVATRRISNKFRILVCIAWFVLSHLANKLFLWLIWEWLLFPCVPCVPFLAFPVAISTGSRFCRSWIRFLSVLLTRVCSCGRFCSCRQRLLCVGTNLRWCISLSSMASDPFLSQFGSPGVFLRRFTEIFLSPPSRFLCELVFRICVLVLMFLLSWNLFLRVL